VDEQTFRSKYGSWAFVAGASEGIGAAFATRLAELGLNLFLVARREDLLEETAQRIRRRSPAVQVETQALDLAAPDLLARLAHLDGRDVGLCVYNAAYAAIQPFLDHSVEQLGAHLDVNCRGPLLLAHQFAHRFRQRAQSGEPASGGIILMSSMVGFAGTSLLGAYAASKSFLVTLGESLYHELGESGTDVLVCVAGATRTPGYLGSEPHYGWFKPTVAEPEQVVEEALAALGKKPVQVAGAGNRITLFVMQRLLGRALATRFMNHTIKQTFSHRD